MNLRIYGKPQKITTELVHKALLFYAGRLMNKRLYSRLTIKLFFRKGLLKSDGLEASCCWDDDNYRPREFIIYIDDGLSKRKTLLSIAHEMIHVKQYATGQLKYLIRGPNNCRWLGKPIKEDDLSYIELPWEKEAWDMESVLYSDFISQKK